MPIVLVLRWRRFTAISFFRYPILSAVSMTSLTVSLLTFCESLESARETVDFDIPSSLAMSFMVMCLMLLSGSVTNVIYKLIINAKILQINNFGNGCTQWERLRERCRNKIKKYFIYGFSIVSNLALNNIGNHQPKVK